MIIAPAARWWHRQGEQIVCDLCPRDCHLHEGQRGFCFVRQNVGGEMQLKTYGRSTGFCIDPIEKKPLNHFLPGTPVLSFGTAGCNLGCKFCQNWEISKSREIDLLADTASPEDIAQAALKAGCRSVAFTYNDPVIWAEYAIDTARACRAAGLKTVAVTAGYITPEARPEFYAEMDAANVDLKGFTEEFYKHVTLSHIEPVLDTLKWLKHESDVWFEITNLMIPGENDAQDETARMCDWIAQNLGPDVPVHFTAFHPDFRMQDIPHTPPATLLAAREIALKAGLHFPYVGNINHVTGQSTYCPGCKAVLIERNWYQLGQWGLQGNCCRRCQAMIPGVFEKRPGNWGPKRQPIRISQTAGDRRQATAASKQSAPTPRPEAPTSSSEPPGASPKVDFTGEEAAAILSHTRLLAEAVLRGRPQPAMSDDLGRSQAYGVFVTFRRQGELRACRGRFGSLQPLGELLSGVVADTVLDDPRFPALTSDELPFLHIDVSLMFGPQTVAGPAESRAAAVTIGRHGLVLSHAKGRGLLLPQVATESRWSAEQFLEAVSGKAGLPSGAWRDPQTRLMTFEARVLDRDADATEPDAKDLSPGDLDRLREIIESVAGRGSQSAAGLPDVLTRPNPHECGLAAQTFQGRLAAFRSAGQSLAQLAAQVGKWLAAEADGSGIKSLSVLTRPLVLRPADHPHRHGSLNRSAIVASREGKLSLQFPEGRQQADHMIAAALRAIQADAARWKSDQGIRVTAFGSVRTHTFVPQADRVRPPAKAGTFYPASAEEIRQEVARHLLLGESRRPYRAVMLPHAGWFFCGEVIGRTLSRTEVPRTVIVIGPKHTPHGANWSVSPADRWAYPGGEVPVATELRARLTELVPMVQVEPEAHRPEHAVEVLVPFLHACQSKLEILPVVLGPTSYSQTERLARGLSALVEESPEPVLLVISSDMNHFAPEGENRRRDLLAVDAFRTGDPVALFDTVTRNEISMCGVIPAVCVLRALHALGQPPRPALVQYTNSAAASGDTSRVVGYAGCVVE